MTRIREIVMAASVAIGASFADSAAPAQAQSFNVSFSSHGIAVRHQHHRPIYRPVYYGVSCYIAPQRRVDAFGNTYFKRVRVCG